MQPILHPKTQTNMHPSLFDTALEYLTEGLNPLPLKGDKSPMLPVGHPYLYQPMNEDDMGKLFGRAEKIGIACGLVSGGFECIDFDGKDGEPILDIFDRFISTPEVAAIMATHDLPYFSTPSGGRHVYYRHGGDVSPSRRLAHWPSGKVMIETRGHGSYVAVYPSKGYIQMAGSEIVKIAQISAEERDCLLAVAEGLTQHTRTVSSGGNGGGRRWPDKFDISAPIGRFNEECADEAKRLLIAAGWRYVYTRRFDGVEYWQRPGKDGDGVSATFGRCHNMFYVFTANALPFEAETAYTPFDIYMLLSYGGDMKAATTSLYRRWDMGDGSLADDFLSPRPVSKIPNPPGLGDITGGDGVVGEVVSADVDDGMVSFPMGVFPPVLQEFINQMQVNLNFTSDFTSIAIMFAIATMNGNKYKLSVNEVWVAPTLFWFAVVGDPGTMKSHPISALIRPIKQLDIEAKKVHSRLMEEYDAAMLDKSIKVKPKRPQFCQIMISDVTLEAIHHVHSTNRRGLGYHRDELLGFINAMNQYKSKGSDEQFWLESFNNQSYMVNRATKETLSIENTMINIIGTIQPSVLSRISVDNGLTDRFLYTSAEKSIPYMALNKMPPEWFKWWSALIHHAHSLFRYIDNQDTVIVSMDANAEQHFRALDKWLVDMQLSDNLNESLKTYLSKAKTYIPRFALLMAIIDAIILDTPVTVTATHMEKAGQVMAYFIETGKQVFNESARVDEIVGIIKSKTGLTRTELIYMLHKKGIKNTEIAKQIRVSKAHVTQVIKKLNEKEQKT